MGPEDLLRQSGETRCSLCAAFEGRESQQARKRAPPKPCDHKAPDSVAHVPSVGGVLCRRLPAPRNGGRSFHVSARLPSTPLPRLFDDGWMSASVSAPAYCLRMTTRAEPGWYVDESKPSQMRFWEGKSWTELTQPLPPNSDEGSPRGWYPVNEELFRWWNGFEWDRFQAARSGAVSVVDFLGQGVITVNSPGGSDATAVAQLMAILRTWPPVRVTSLNTYTGPVGAGTVLTAVVEWDAPNVGTS